MNTACHIIFNASVSVGKKKKYHLSFFPPLRSCTVLFIRPATFIIIFPATHYCQLTLHDLGSLNTNNVVNQWPES
jgi:hypothetical protein